MAAETVGILTHFFCIVVVLSPERCAHPLIKIIGDEAHFICNFDTPSRPIIGFIKDLPEEQGLSRSKQQIRIVCLFPPTGKDGGRFTSGA